jgi:hypothetical protein
MLKFEDVFTGTVYEMGPEWLEAVRKELAEHIKGQLKEDPKGSADAVAEFWRDTYYKLLFPLRFGLEKKEGLFVHQDLFPDPGPVDLEPLAGKEFRQGFLDGSRLPPLLPAVEDGETSELLADRVLTQTALANLLLRRAKTPEAVLHAVRLAFLTYPLLEHLEESLDTQVVQIARFVMGESSELPEGVDRELLEAVREERLPEDAQVWPVLVAAQRIKRYVFETPGLNEIRGASTLLDEWTEASEKTISLEIGPEVVLRAVGSMLIFLAPSEEEANGWMERLQRVFYQATGTAFVAAAKMGVPAGKLLKDYRYTIEELFEAMERDRARGEIPLTEVLPFEARCRICRTRPADGWATDLPGETEPVLLCRACRTKYKIGRDERRGKLWKVLKEWLNLEDPSELGVRAEGWMAYAIGRVADRGFIPDDARRALLATIYGDGNNFGAIGQKLESIAMGLQWTKRVEWVTKAATAIALARATQETAKERGWKPGGAPALPRLPFQVLALGGEDLSLLAWGAVGVRFAQHFSEMMNIEFRTGKGKRFIEKPIAFSLGVLLADCKAPVRRTVDFAENVLLKWAKRAFRESNLKEGNVAMLLAITPEQIPPDIKAYREEMFTKKGLWRDLCLTLRPFTAEELGFLLKKATELRRDGMGPFQRLVEAFVKSPPLVAMLHYLYQRARVGNGDNWMTRLEAPAEQPDSLKGMLFPAAQLNGRLPFGIPKRERKMLFSPLWDILELVKIIE